MLSNLNKACIHMSKYNINTCLDKQDRFFCLEKQNTFYKKKPLNASRSRKDKTN